MIAWASLLVMGLAAHYLVYIITQSEFPLIAKIRDWIATRWGDESWQAYLSTCGWCVSAYVSAAVVGITASQVVIPLPALVWAAVASLSSIFVLLTNFVSDYGLKVLKDLTHEVEPPAAPKAASPITPRKRRHGRS